MPYRAILIATLLASCGSDSGVQADPDIAEFCTSVVDLTVDCWGYPRALVERLLDCDAYDRDNLCPALYLRRELISSGGIEIEGVVYDEDSMGRCVAEVSRRTCEELQEHIPPSCSQVCRQ